MKLATTESYLVLQSTSTAKRSVRIVDSQASAIKSWSSSTRVSPIFVVGGIGTATAPFNGFRGSTTLIFLGPVNPEKLRPHAAQITRLWLSLGLLNTVVQTGKRGKAALLSWAQKQCIPFEVWDLSNGTIVNSDCSQPLVSPSDWRDELAALADSTCPPELREALHEYAPLLASTLSRSCILDPIFVSEVLQMHGELSDMVGSAKSDSTSPTSYEALGELFTFNAALSRYSSQTFAGTPPVTETECHLWSHSLLGIGIATIAIRNLRHFFQRTLGAWRLIDRFSALRNRSTNGINLQYDPIPEDLLGSVPIDCATLNVTEPIIPLLTYFSGRDGYRSTGMTISAPLAAIGSCNSTRWSLLTLTHELSHVVIRAILSELLPDLRDEAGLRHCLKLLESNSPGSNYLDELTRKLLFTLVRIDDAAAGRTRTPAFGIDGLQGLIRRWRHDVDEILVHAFDYLYFYGRSLPRYISGIWASWGAIPNISTRVPDYVVRSICTAMTTTLSRGTNAARLAKDAVYELLVELRDSGHGGRYVDEAITFIDVSWETDIKPKVEARCELIWLATAVLFSETAATAVRSETEIVGGEGETEGYPHRPGVLDLRPIANPLRFIEIYTTSKEPSPSLSLWLLYVLAFCYQDG